MKRIVSIVAFALLFCILTSCAGCTSCGKKLETVNAGNLYDKKTETVYAIAPSYYEAVAWESDIYKVDSHGFGYHKVRDIDGNTGDPTQWLYNYENNILLYNSEIKLPTLREMDPDGMSFFIEGDSRVILTVEDNKDAIGKAIEFVDSPAMTFNGKTAESSYRIRFTSSKYKYIAYYVIYLEYAEDQYEYVSLKGQYTSVEEIEANYDFIDGVEHEILTENDGSFTVAYNYGKYFVYVRDEGKCYMAGHIHDVYNSAGETAK